MRESKRFVMGWLRAVVLFAGVVGGAASAPAAEVEPLLQRLPASSCLVMASRDTSATCAAFAATDLGEKLCGEEFAPLIAALRSADRGSPLHLRPWIGLDWPALATVKSPSVVAALPLKDGSAGIVWLFGGDDADRAALEASVREYYTAERWAVVQKKLGDSSATTYSPPPGVKQAPRVWFDGAGYCGMANSSAALTALLATKPDQSFAASDAAKTFASESDDSAANVSVFVQPLVLWKTLAAPPPGKTLAMKDPVLAAERLGFGGITQVVGVVKLAVPAPGDWQVEAQAVVPEPYPKALKMLDMLPGERLDPPRWLGDDVARISHWRWDFVRGMQAFGHVFDEASDPGPAGEGLFEQVLDGLRDDPEGPRVDLRTELFPKLGPEVTTVALPGRTLTLVRIAPQHVAAVNDFLKRFYQNDAQVEFQKIGDFQLWSGKGDVPIFADAGEPKESSIRAMALGQNQLWIATSTPWLKELIRLAADDAAKAPLVQAPAWSAHRKVRDKWANPRTAYEAFTQPDHAWRNSYDAATKPLAAKQQDSASTRAWHFLLFGTTRRQGEIPYTAAPPFERWGKQLPAVSTFLSRTKNGWDIAIVPLRLEK